MNECLDSKYFPGKQYPALSMLYKIFEHFIRSLQMDID